jgi:cytochrome c biogenesis protein CcmG/thiol:disulfide interchange protein DsbE
VSARTRSPQRRNPRAVQRRNVRGANRTWIMVCIVLVVIGIAAVIAVSASGGGDNSAKATSHETGAVEVVGSALPDFHQEGSDPAIGETIPTLNGVTFDGSSITIGPTGRPKVVMFVAHWCPHCQAEVPRIVDLEKDGAFARLDVSSVATGTDPSFPNYPPSAWLKSAGWPFPVMADSSDQTAARAYGLTAYPFFVFADAQGKVVGRATGEIAPSNLSKILNALATGEPLPSASGASSSAN